MTTIPGCGASASGESTIGALTPAAEAFVCSCSFACGILSKSGGLRANPIPSAVTAHPVKIDDRPRTSRRILISALFGKKNKLLIVGIESATSAIWNYGRCLVMTPHGRQ